MARLDSTDIRGDLTVADDVQTDDVVVRGDLHVTGSIRAPRTPSCVELHFDMQIGANRTINIARSLQDFDAIDIVYADDADYGAYYRATVNRVDLTLLNHFPTNTHWNPGNDTAGQSSYIITDRARSITLHRYDGNQGPVAIYGVTY